MATLLEQRAKAKALQPDKISRMLFEFIRSIEKELLDLNRKELFDNSKDIHGNAIGFYSKATEIITGGRKKAGEPFDAKETGDFFEGFYMQEVAGVLRFGSTDPKTNDILSSESWLSTELFGLNDNDLGDVIQTRLLPFVQNLSREKLEI